MKFILNLKHYLYTGLREVLVYHHSSLEFRAKTFALVISANSYPSECAYDLVLEAGMQIYKDKERAKMLLLTTREYVEKVHKKNGLYIDDLVEDIRREVRQAPRFVSKIDISLLEPIVECSIDEDTSTYQIRMLDFLAGLKEEKSNEKKHV